MKSIKRLILKQINSMGWELKKMGLDPGVTYDQDGIRTIHNADFLRDPQFITAFERGLMASEKDYKNHWRVHIALWVGQNAARVPGDFVECGVNKGFVSSAMMKDLNWDTLNKTYWLLDTFEGIDERFITEKERQDGILTRNEGDFYVRGVESVKRNFAEWENVQIVVGAVPETLTHVSAKSVAYLHLDMNCAPPEVEALKYFWPLMSPGGIILMDDYCYFGYQEQHIALKQTASELDAPILSLPTGQGLIIKPSH